MGQISDYDKWLEDSWDKYCDELDNQPCCGNCIEYDGDRCHKDWNNNDDCYYIPDRDDKSPYDYCEDWERDPDV